MGFYDPEERAWDAVVHECLCEIYPTTGNFHVSERKRQMRKCGLKKHYPHKAELKDGCLPGKIDSMAILPPGDQVIRRHMMLFT